MNNAQTAPAHHNSSLRLRDREARHQKAKKIKAVISKASVLPLQHCTLLDVGCSYGYITEALAPDVRACIGIEYDGQALEARSIPLFVHGDATKLPIADNSINIAICAQVYEHVSDADAMFAEIWRVLAPGGICFFSGPNRLFPYEYHYHLPFVHWFPPKPASWLLKLIKPGSEHDVRSRGLWALRRSLAHFDIHDYTLPMITEPQRYHTEQELGRFAWLRHIPNPLLRLLLPFVPNFNWVLTKPLDAKNTEEDCSSCA